MKISRTFLVLIFVVLILFAGAIYSAKTAQEIRNDEDIKCREQIKRHNETPCISRFFYSTVPEIDRNFADYIAMCLFILAMSTTVAAIWIKKHDA